MLKYFKSCKIRQLLEDLHESHNSYYAWRHWEAGAPSYNLDVFNSLGMLTAVVLNVVRYFFAFLSTGTF